MEIQSTPGLVEFIGDEPYSNVSTFSEIEIHRDFPINQEEIWLFSSSIREAIDHYLPYDIFLTWIDRFTETYKRHAHYTAISTSLDNIFAQFNR